MSNGNVPSSGKCWDALDDTLSSPFLAFIVITESTFSDAVICVDDVVDDEEDEDDEEEADTVLMRDVLTKKVPESMRFAIDHFGTRTSGSVIDVGAVLFAAAISAASEPVSSSRRYEGTRSTSNCMDEGVMSRASKAQVTGFGGCLPLMRILSLAGRSTAADKVELIPDTDEKPADIVSGIGHSFLATMRFIDRTNIGALEDDEDNT